MTGIEALVASQEGKKVTKLAYKGSYYAYMIEHELYAKPYKTIVWICVWEQSPIDPMVSYNSDIVNVDLFLQDDWEIHEWYESEANIEDYKQAVINGEILREEDLL